MLLALTIAASLAQPVFGVIYGGEGNAPLADPGLPEGAIAILNNPARVAWWEGPPFGGGQWHGEYRGEASALNAILAEFAKLNVDRKRVIVHDGVGNSFWLNPNNEPAKRADSTIDWSFMIWQSDKWEQFCKMPVDLRRIGERECDQGLPSEIAVYTGSIRWADVSVPEGIDVVDKRLEAHGFTLADSPVLEGRITDLITREPIPGHVRLERVEPPREGRHHYTQAAESNTDPKGHWVLKNIPAGTYRLVIEAEGYVSRIAGYAGIRDRPRWQSYDCGLARPATVSGRVTDEADRPLADVEVRLANVTSAGDGRYESPRQYTAISDADGYFHLDQVPIGNATVRVRRSGYCRPGLGLPITTSAADVILSMKLSASLRVTVDFSGTQRPAEYVVNLEPEGGSKVGSWGGGGKIDEKNQFLYEDVPPERYVLKGHPNPSRGDQSTEPITIELKGGEEKKVTLSAK
jgi:hypothetical protein